DDAVELLDVDHAAISRGKTRVRAQIGPPHRLKQRLREHFHRCTDGNETVPSAIRAQWREARNAEPGALRHSKAFEYVERLARNHHGHYAEHRNVYVLADSRAARLHQRGQYPDYAEQRSAHIRDRNADADRGIALRAGGHHESAERLDDGVHGFSGARFPVAPEARERAIDNARIDLARVLVSGAEAVHRAAAEILEDHIGAAHQVIEDLARLGVLEIESDCLFIPQAVDGRDGDIVVMATHESGAVFSQIRSILAAGIG